MVDRMPPAYKQNTQ